MSFLPLAPRNRCGDHLTSPVGPRDDRHFLSSETNRFICPFHRATAEAGIDTRLKLETRRTRLFSGTARSKSDTVRLDKGFQDLGLGVFLGTFCTSKKYPGVRGRVAPETKLRSGWLRTRPVQWGQSGLTAQKNECSRPLTAGREHDRSHFVVPPTFSGAGSGRGQLRPCCPHRPRGGLARASPPPLRTGLPPASTA